MKKNEATPNDTFAVVLLKCNPRHENDIRDAIAAGRAAIATGKPGAKLCLAPERHACKSAYITIVDAAYCFGAFDFLLVVRSSEVRRIERFVVDCVRASTLVTDTQTILGVSF
jgi:hypothetical protein